jgi:CheY-like chemotaxis protein
VIGLILLIDDHDDCRRMTERLIRRWGHLPLVTDTGETGLELLTTVRPDLIIVDGRLPGMNGVEFIQQARAIEEMATIPIILYTAHSYFAEDALKEGANEICVKGSVEGTPERMREMVAQYV